MESGHRLHSEIDPKGGGEMVAIGMRGRKEIVSGRIAPFKGPRFVLFSLF